MNQNNYITDEELRALIEVSEMDGLLSAPKQLKSDILAAAYPVRTPQQDSKRKQFISYCIRTGFACAACLTILFSFSPETLSLSPSDKPDQANQALSQLTENVNNHYQTINNLLSNFVNNFGGSTYE